MLEKSYQKDVARLFNIYPKSSSYWIPAKKHFQHTKEITENDGGDFNEIEEGEDDEEFHPDVVEFNRAFKEVNFFVTTVVKCCW